jgi:hypothetical protein
MTGVEGLLFGPPGDEGVRGDDEDERTLLLAQETAQRAHPDMAFGG